MRKLLLWVPVLMVGSLVYWTIALNFGGLSLLALSSFAGAAGDGLLQQVDQGDGVKDSYQPITVNLADGEEVADRADTDEPIESVTVEVVSDRDTARSDLRGAGDRSGSNDTGPGETAF